MFEAFFWVISKMFHDLAFFFQNDSNLFPFLQMTKRTSRVIPYEQDDILRPERFSPSLDILHNMGTAQSVTCFNFATKIEQQAHYYPRLSVTCHRRLGGYSQKLKIEFSAMKLINQPPNNLEEVCDEDFEEIIAVLQKRLFELGIQIVSLTMLNAVLIR